MKRLLRLGLIATVAVAGGFADACLNDRDSLFIETMGHQRDLLKTVIGWFPVHSSLYYQMRIKRCEAELVTHPEHLAIYDDLAVAYDRQNDDVHAIEAIERKRTYMLAHGIKEHVVVSNPEQYPSKDDIAKSSMDPWYRYYANVGTFWAHRWFHGGMPEDKKKAWMDLAQTDIDHAIKLNPYAHGLREFAQAEVIRWVRTGKPKQKLSDFIEDENLTSVAGLDTALAGLVDLGGAWESPDVYEALSTQVALSRPDLSYFIYLRAEELQRSGKKSRTRLSFGAFESIAKVADPTKDEQEFKNLREAAEGYRKDLLAFEQTHLEAGHHPDDDPQFWSGYTEPKFPDYGRRPTPFIWPPAIFWVVLAPMVAFVVVALLVVRNWIRGRRTLRESRAQ